MNREQTIESIKIMQAWVDGKTIEGCTRNVEPWIEGSPWEPIVGDPQWDWTRFDYRIKPEPMVAYVTTYEHGPQYSPFGGVYRSEDEAKCHMHEGGKVRKFVEVMDEPAKPESPIPQTYTFKVGDEGLTEGGWRYKVILVEKGQYGEHIGVNHEGRCQLWHAMDGNAGSMEGYSLMPPGVKPLSQT